MGLLDHIWGTYTVHCTYLIVNINPSNVIALVKGQTDDMITINKSTVSHNDRGIGHFDHKTEL
jgi:hypothetical protein